MTSLFSTIIPLQLTDVKANLTYTDGLIFSLWITWLYPVSTATVQVFTLGVFLLLLFPSFSNRKQTRCIWFTSGGSRRGRVLPAPPQNVLRGVEGGAAVGVIYFVNIFRPQGPHSHPPWPVSRPRLSARESITSSGYGPFKVFPQLWKSLSCFSCSSGRGGGHAILPCHATAMATRPQGAGPPGASQGRGPTGPVPVLVPLPRCTGGATVTHLSLLAYSGHEASSSLPEQPKTCSAAGPSFSFLSPRHFPPPHKIPGPVLEAGISPPSPGPWLGGWRAGSYSCFLHFPSS